MSQRFEPGDFLVFQLESGFALLRLLAVDEQEGDKTWHVAAYADLFPDVETAEIAIAGPGRLTTTYEHIALTNRAFESTQVARIANRELTAPELEPLGAWRLEPAGDVSDRSVRLLLGIR